MECQQGLVHVAQVVKITHGLVVVSLVKVIPSKRSGRGAGSWSVELCPSLPKSPKYLVRIGVKRNRTSGGVKVGPLTPILTRYDWKTRVWWMIFVEDLSQTTSP